MKRSGFKQRERRPEKIIEGYTPRPRVSVLRIHDGKARASVPIPKPEKAKPGKRAPTVEERTWLDAITSIGCIACLIDGHPGTPGAVHHMLRGGRRIGHLHTLSLCQPGHHMDGQAHGKISRHPWLKRFEAAYGTEAELLERSRALIQSSLSNFRRA